ncbi:RHS repeat domain-containing protein [Ralstonia edaphi]|nr:RHS repeat domain-containing protein [Ralstonia sp. LMG 6871]
MQCANGYASQPDGSCAPTRPPVQICSAGNPVISGVGTTVAIDRNNNGSSELPTSFAYRSYSVYGTGNGAGQWTLNWQRSLDVSLASYDVPWIVGLRDDGSVFAFRQNGTTWTAAGTQDALVSVTDANGKVANWQYTMADTGSVETYDATGKLLSVREQNGRTTTLAYNTGGRLATVTAPTGRTLGVAYDGGGRIASLKAPDGAVTSYAYNGAGMLSTVTSPDGSLRQYVYEDGRFPTALTGVIDENGNRYATYAYDDQARAVSSSHAGGADAYQFQYGADYQTTVTDPTGKTSVYSFLKQNGVLLPTSISAPCGLCGSTRQSSEYDSNNNLIRETDYLGNVTTHAYDSQKREIQRVEGAGTPGARTVTTEWHPTWNLQTRVASPTKLEVYGYDSNGNLTSYGETPTSDSNGGQGFSATAAGPTRTTTWTYTADGQVASRSGPRTDVNDGTTYVYRTADDTNTPPQYRKGDLYQIVDALGYTTTINQYDPNGRPLQMTDANGGVTTFAYSNRGWLTSQTVTPASGTAQTTNYSYDAVGQLTKVALPDGSSVRFTYDAAHRMTGATDSLGNSIMYTLDVMGNRTQEHSKDPGGNLARQITRVFDSMNRPLKVTIGATQ